MIEYIVDFFANLVGKEKTAVISNLSKEDFRRFVKNSKKFVRETDTEFQLNHGGLSRTC